MAADSRLFVGGLADQVTEDLLYELFLQVGPLEGVTRPKKRNGSLARFGFVNFVHPESVSYAIQVMDGIKLFGEVLRLKPGHEDDDDDDESVSQAVSATPSHHKAHSLSPHPQSHQHTESKKTDYHRSQPRTRNRGGRHHNQRDRKRKMAVSHPPRAPHPSRGRGRVQKRPPHAVRGKPHLRIPYNGPVDLPSCSVPFSMTRSQARPILQPVHSTIRHGFPQAQHFSAYGNANYTQGSNGSGNQPPGHQHWYPGNQQQSLF